jgi:hypothetical protein
MRVAPGAEVPLHRDQSYHWLRRVRVHVPIMTDAAVMMSCDGERKHFPAGEAWILDTRRVHGVTNQSVQDRVHLVLDTEGSDPLFASVGTGGSELVEIPYAPGQCPEIALEPPTLDVATPAEIDVLFGIVETAVARSASALGTSAITVRLNAFKERWRTTFDRHGRDFEGAAVFALLIGEFQRDVTPLLGPLDGDAAWAVGVMHSMRSTMEGAR